VLLLLGFTAAGAGAGAAGAGAAGAVAGGGGAVNFLLLGLLGVLLIGFLGVDLTGNLWDGEEVDVLGISSNSIRLAIFSLSTILGSTGFIMTLVEAGTASPR
jgi:hypothetical protein